MAGKNNGQNPISELKEKHKEKLEERKNAFIDKAVSEQAQVRRDKLAALQERGNDPFLITRYDQTHHTDEVKALYEEQEARLLAGWEYPSVEGLDDEQKKQVLKEDYNKRNERRLLCSGNWW